MKEDLSAKLSGDDHQRVVSMCTESMNRTREQTKKRQVSKLGSLLEKKKSGDRGTGYTLRPEGLEKWVVNLSGRELSQDQESVLRLGILLQLQKEYL